ncbi:MAG: efflux transporter outer membrane subunit [Tatlockia sp.]
MRNSRSLLSWFLTGLASLCILAGCVNYSGIHSNKKIAPPTRFLSPEHLPKAKGDWPTMDWASQFGDPQLTALIQDALANNPDLDIAKARISQALAAIQGKKALLYPNVKAAGALYRVRLSSKRLLPDPLGNSYFTQPFFLTSLNYTLDLWGKNRAQLKQSISEAKARATEEQESRLAISTSIASTYIQLAYYYDLRDVVRQTVSQREALDKISKIRLKSGLDTKVELYQASNLTGVAKTRLIEVEGQIVLTRQQLGVLSGVGIERGLRLKRPKIVTPSQHLLPDNLPLNLLGRRPDIAKARFAVEAACHGIRFVKAQFYPNINLKAGVGYLAFALSQFTVKANAEYLGPAVTLPIFDAGALRAQLKGQYGIYEEAVANYDVTLNKAFSEVMTQLTSLTSTIAQLRTEAETVSSAKHAFRLAKDQYRAGLASQLVVLNAETLFLNARESQLKRIANQRTLQIALIKALGGGFNACLFEAPRCINPKLMSK